MNDIIYAGKHLRTYSVVKHFHDDWEMIYCTSGNGEIFFDGGSVEYSKGDIIIIPPFLMHENCSASGFTNVHLRMKDATLSFTTITKVSDDTERHIYFSFNDAFYYYNGKFEKKELILTALGNLISSYIIAFMSHIPMSPVVESIKSSIVKNFPNCSFELNEYMRTLPFSYDYLRKLFKTEMGMTPHNYLTAMRMETAAKLLCVKQNGEYNVSRIAYMCGFEEPLYFSRVFKKHYGHSPIYYAKIHGNTLTE